MLYMPKEFKILAEGIQISWPRNSNFRRQMNGGIMSKYIITVRKDEYGQIEVEANDRKEAQTVALSEGNCKKIQWYNNPDYKVVEVELLADCTTIQDKNIYNLAEGI
jgi:hypothetical protein